MNAPQQQIPAPPEGFEYFGVGPLNCIPDDKSYDIAAVTQRPNDNWETGFQGYSSDHYAIRVGTELHRLNFEERTTTSQKP